MRAVDTNFLVRLLALVKTVWALDTVYACKPAQIAVAIDMLLNHQHLVLECGDIASAALARYRGKSKPGFSDCLMLEIARAAGHLPFGTFDKPLGQLEGAQLLRS